MEELSYELRELTDTELDEGEWRAKTRRYQEHFGVESEILG